MYFFYIDESGSRDPPPGTADRPKDHIHVLLAVGLYERQWRPFELEVRFLTVCQTICTVWILRLLDPVMKRVTSREFQRNFGRFQDEALRAPLSITRNGRERLVLLSVEEYARLKRRDREALFVEELSEAEVEAIRRAEPSADAAQYDHELTAADDHTP